MQIANERTWTLSAICHEIRNPLNGARQQAQAIVRHASLRLMPRDTMLRPCVR